MTSRRQLLFNFLSHKSFINIETEMSRKSRPVSYLHWLYTFRNETLPQSVSAADNDPEKLTEQSNGNDPDKLTENATSGNDEEKLTNQASDNAAQKKLTEQANSESNDSSSDDESAVIKPKKKGSGHRVGFKDNWKNNRPWLFTDIVTMDDESGATTKTVMKCSLCQKYQLGGQQCKAWTETGYATLRLDKIVEHERSVQHKNAILADIEERNRTQATEKNSKQSVQAVKDALLILKFIIDHNLSLSIFGPLVQLAETLGAVGVKALNRGKNAKHTSWDSINELLACLSDAVDNQIVNEVQQSSAFSLLADEVADCTSTKQLAVACRYVHAGTVKTCLLNTLPLPDGTADVVTEALRGEMARRHLNSQKLTALGSDGASTFSGIKKGVAAQLKVDNQKIIFIHCRDHRLALANKDTFGAIPLLNKIDELLNDVYKYYKYSTVNNARLKQVQEAFEQKKLVIKQAKHHRWLSHNQAVSSIVRSFQCLITDLEQRSISGDAVGNGILKRFKQPTILYGLLLLADVLPIQTDLSLFFQRDNLHLGMVEGAVEKAIGKLNKLKEEDGFWMRQYYDMAEAVGIDRSDAIKSIDSLKQTRVTYLEKLQENMANRFEETQTVSTMGILDTSLLHEIPPMYGLVEVSDLAQYFGLPEDEVLHQWDQLLDLIKLLPSTERGLDSILKFLMKENEHSGILTQLPYVTYLYSVALSLPLSTACVERIFSQLALIKTNHRNRLKADTLQHLMKLKVNSALVDLEQLLPVAAVKYLSMKQRRL